MFQMNKSLSILNFKLAMLIHKKKLIRKIQKILILMDFNLKNIEIFKKPKINLMMPGIKILKIFKAALKIKLLKQE